MNVLDDQDDGRVSGGTLEELNSLKHTHLERNHF